MNHQQPAREPPATPRTPAAGGTTAAPLSAPGDRIEGRRVLMGDEMSTSQPDPIAAIAEAESAALAEHLAGTCHLSEWSCSFCEAGQA